MVEITRKIISLLQETADELSREGVIKDSLVFQPRDIVIPRERENGHLCTPGLSRVDTGLPKKEFFDLFARRLTEKISSGTESGIEKVEPAPPVFLNFFLRPAVLHRELENAVRENFFCRDGEFAGRRYLLEFVSANPTGPLTVAHGRQAAFGESLARILAECGAEVTREYYLNDEGRQVELLGRSLEARCRQLLGREADLPEDGYQGDYLLELASRLTEGAGEKLLENDASFFRLEATRFVLGLIRKDLADFGVEFDSWQSQGELEREGLVSQALKILEEKESVYASEGALFLNTSRFGDDKDRVLRKSDGSFTYLMPDIAYHRRKMERGFDFLVNLWGPDHSGYINRLRASLAILGYDPDRLKVIIVQLTTLYRAKEKVAMSTRQGEFLPLSRLIEELSPDVGKFFFLSRKADSHLDFDLELARRDSSENPIYYLKYATARIASLFREQARLGVEHDPGRASLGLLREPEEQEIMIMLGRFAPTVISAARGLEPQVLFAYLVSLVRIFHRYYQRCKILVDDRELSAARLTLVGGLEKVLRRGLYLLNVEAPRKM